MVMNEESSSAARGPATRVAVENLARLKPDHRVLLGALLADAGMAPATLELLAEHLLEEEGPQMLAVVARTKAGVSAALASSTIRTGTTVGDLRSTRVAPPSGPGTVGALRR